MLPTLLLSVLEHAHMRPACPPDLSHTHPRNYGERTGGCQPGWHRGYILHCSRSLITPVLLTQTLLVRYFIMCSYVTGSFFVLLLSLRTENEMLWCVALTGWDRDVEEVKITFIHSAFPPPRVYSPLILAFCCPTLEAAWHLWYACSRWHRSGRVESGFLRTNADKWTDN